MTLDEAKSLKQGQYVYQNYVRNQKGEPRRWKVNGMVKVWKRNPSRVQVPVKHGLHTFGYITEGNCHLLDLEPRKE